MNFGPKIGINITAKIKYKAFFGRNKGMIGNIIIVEHPKTNIMNNNSLIPSKVTTITFIIFIRTLNNVPRPVASPCSIFPKNFMIFSILIRIISKFANH